MNSLKRNYSFCWSVSRFDIFILFEFFVHGSESAYWRFEFGAHNIVVWLGIRH